MEKREVILIKQTPKLNIPSICPVKRAVAYARVSTASDEQLNSIEAQKDYYCKYIQNRPNWLFMGLYADEGITGTSCKNREQFKMMITDAENGKFDIIVTKSISRFARNTVDTLQNIRLLKEVGVAVYFEKEDINTMDAKGEFLITLLSSMAQEESRSISENVTWGIRKRFADGIYSIAYANFLGYKKGSEAPLEIEESTASVVRYIYYLFLLGKTTYHIANILTLNGIKTPSGKNKWHSSVVINILTNEKYKGSALLQKKYICNYLTKKAKTNNGELPKYYIENDHEPIIPKDLWDYVQSEYQARDMKYSCVSTFCNKLICAHCGNRYIRAYHNGFYNPPKAYYRCRNKYSKSQKCYNPTIDERDLLYYAQSAIAELFIEYMSDDKFRRTLKTYIEGIIKKTKPISPSFETLYSNCISKAIIKESEMYILVHHAVISDDRQVRFFMLDGTEITYSYQKKSHS